MARDGTTWRTHPLRVGGRYEVKQASAAVDGTFEPARRYRLVNVGHSHHDECTLFTFVDEATRASRVWAWPDDAPESVCRDAFTEC